MLQTEMVLKKLIGHLSAERLPILKRVIEVKPGKNARPVNLVKPVSRIFKCVGMDAVAEDRAVDNNMHFASAEEVRYQTGN